LVLRVRQCNYGTRKGEEKRKRINRKEIEIQKGENKQRQGTKETKMKLITLYKNQLYAITITLLQTMYK
jgi:hypothetical protein